MYEQKKSVKQVAKPVLLAGLFAVIGLTIIYAVKGIYPFGGRNISYYDMAQSFVPLYYRAYDILHGVKDFFWDWQSGLGVGTMDTLGSFVLSPFNLFFFFVRRDHILESMSFFLLLKEFCIAGSMAFYSKKTYLEVEDFWHVLIGVLYGGCGFVIQYYTSIHYLDMVVLFPIIMYFADRLLKEDKVKGFILCVTLGLVINFYLMFFAFVFLVLYAPLVLKDFSKEERGKKIATLGFGVVIGVVLSGLVTYPYVLTLMGSARTGVSDKANQVHVIWRLFDRYFGNKIMMLYGGELVIGMVLFALIFKKKERKSFIPWGVLALLLAVPIWFELINFAWHPGGYVDFPMRFGYILSFFLLSFAGRILETGADFAKEPSEKMAKVIHYLSLLLIAAIPFACLALYYYLEGYLLFGIRDLTAFSPYYSILIMFPLLYGIIFLMQGKAKKYLCAFLIAVQFLLGWYGLLAPMNMYASECLDDIVTKGEKVHTLVKNEEGRDYRRIKDISNTLNANYPFIIEKAALSNWTWGGKGGTREVLKNLGYSTNYTRFLDNGGTLFTDGFFAVDEIITLGEIGEESTEIGSVEDYKVAKVGHTYPFGLVVDADTDFTHFSENATGFLMQNELFAKVSGSKENLIAMKALGDVCKQEMQSEDGKWYYFCEVPVDGYKELYLQADLEENHISLWMNEKPVIMPDMGNPENTVFPGSFVNGFVDLGSFRDEVLLCVVEADKRLENNVDFGLLDVNLLWDNMEQQSLGMREVKNDKNSMTLTLHSVGGENLLLPLQYEENCRVFVNGKKVAAAAACDGAFFLVPLEEGENVVQLKFVPGGLMEGCLITLLGIGLFVFFAKKKETITGGALMGKVATISFLLVWVGFLLYLYVIPFVRTIVAVIQYKM